MSHYINYKTIWLSICAYFFYWWPN